MNEANCFPDRGDSQEETQITTNIFSNDFYSLNCFY